MSDKSPLGQRNEGPLITGQTMDGSIPIWAISVWTFEGKAGQTVEISIDPGDPEAKLMLDVIDQDGKSIISEGASSFTGSTDGDQISLPNSGIYTIQVSPQFNPSPMKNWYGWYKITLQ
jgi:hypothetical protein